MITLAYNNTVSVLKVYGSFNLRYQTKINILHMRFDLRVVGSFWKNIFDSESTGVLGSEIMYFKSKYT